MVSAADVAREVNKIAAEAQKNVILDPNVVDQSITELWVEVRDNDFEWPVKDVWRHVVAKLVNVCMRPSHGAV